jgi:septum site-determining protein MinD
VQQVIAFISGKGGMGKTALCAAIAGALAKTGRKVLCIDCDSGTGDLSHYLGLAESQNLTYSDVALGHYALDSATAHPDFPGLRFLDAPSGREPLDHAAFAALLRQAKQRFDYILLDAPPLQIQADAWLLVTQADPAAIRGARHMADLLELQGAQNLRLLVNAIDRKEMSALLLTVDDVMDQTGLPLLGILPRDSALKLAAAQGKHILTYTKKGAAAAALRIADRLQGKHVTIPSRVI